MSVPVIRIFSDLHYRDSESRLQSLDTLLPLLDGADQVVLNGDTLDTQPPAAPADLAEVRAFFTRHTGPVTFLSGNHDPDISDRAELSLQDGRVWITHGDVFFDNIAPWSSLRAEMARRLATLTRDLPAVEHGRLETRLRLNRLACLRLPEPHDRSHRSLTTRVARLTHTLFPPHRLLAMLRAWCATPALARRLAGEQRPRARLVVLGHTHHPGVWKDRASGVTVVNTGTFCPPFGARFVELQGDRVRVVRIVWRGGAFHPGRTVAEFPLAP